MAIFRDFWSCLNWNMSCQPINQQGWPTSLYKVLFQDYEYFYPASIAKIVYSLLPDWHNVGLVLIPQQHFAKDKFSMVSSQISMAFMLGYISVALLPIFILFSSRVNFFPTVWSIWNPRVPVEKSIHFYYMPLNISFNILPKPYYTQIAKTLQKFRR